MTDTAPRKLGVQSLDRALAILRTFGPEAPSLGVSEIARRSDLTVSTAHRLLASLMEHGLVMRAAGSNGYTLGPELLRLAGVARETIRLHDLATPVMVDLRDASDETVGLHVTDRGLTRQVLHQVPSRQPLRRIYTEMGKPVPLHQGAPGKVLLAHLPEKDLRRVLSRKMEKVTSATIVDPDEVRGELEGVRERGYALSMEERIPGIASIAAPIWDHAQEVIAAMSISGPSSRMTEERLYELAPSLREATSALSQQLGGKPGAH